MLLYIVNDFPAYGNLSGLCVKAYKVCPICDEGTKFQYLKHSKNCVTWVTGSFCLITMYTEIGRIF